MNNTDLPHPLDLRHECLPTQNIFRPNSETDTCHLVASVLSCITIELTVILRSSISPCASTFTSFPRSPNDTAFLTSEMDRIGRWGLMPFSAAHGRISGAERRRNKHTLTFLVKSADVPWHLDNIAPCLPLSTHPSTVSSKPTMSYFTMSNGHGCPGPAVYG